MALSQIIIRGCFSRELDFNIPAEIIHDLSQFKFDGESELNFLEHFFKFMYFCISNGIQCKYIMANLFTLAFKGRVKKWCHMLPVAFVHSLEKLVKDLREAFESYDYQYVCDRIDFLIMEPGESVNDFFNWFLHLCCEFLKGVIDSNFIMENF